MIVPTLAHERRQTRAGMKLDRLEKGKTVKDRTIAKAVRIFLGSVLAPKERGTFTVTAQAELIGGNLHPHFSVTAEYRNGGGCMHDDILLAWPEVAPIVALHLSNSDDGEPMHAEADGWYNMAGALGGAGAQFHAGNSERQIYKADGSFDAYRKPTPDECLKFLAEHLRISLDEAEALRTKVAASIDRQPGTVGYAKACKAGRAFFAGFVEAQRARWAQEAAAGLALIRSLGTREATDAENRAAIQRRRDLAKAQRNNTLAGVPAPPKGAVFHLVEVREVIMPHPFVITDKHLRASTGTLNPDAAPCGYPDCKRSAAEHVASKALFVRVPQNDDLNSVPGLVEYLNTAKPVCQQLGIEHFAFPVAA